MQIWQRFRNWQWENTLYFTSPLTTKSAFPDISQQGGIEPFMRRFLSLLNKSFITLIRSWFMLIPIFNTLVSKSTRKHWCKRILSPGTSGGTIWYDIIRRTSAIVWKYGLPPTLTHPHIWPLIVSQVWQFQWIDEYRPKSGQSPYSCKSYKHYLVTKNVNWIYGYTFTVLGTLLDDGECGKDINCKVDSKCSRYFSRKWFLLYVQRYHLPITLFKGITNKQAVNNYLPLFLIEKNAINSKLMLLCALLDVS